MWFGLPCIGIYIRAGLHWSQVLSPNYDMDVYMVTLFGGEAWDLC